VRIESGIALGNQTSIEPRRAAARLIAGNQQDALPQRIECNGDPPDAAIGIEAQLLHIRVFRSMQRIHSRSTQLRTEMLQQLGLREQFEPDRLGKQPEFRLELRRKANDPSHD
jgi:hypothetical protein